MEDGSKTLRLKHPIVFGERSVEELVFRVPSAKDFRKLEMRDGYSIDVILKLASRLSGQPDAVIDKVMGGDLSELFSVVAGFMPGGLATGDTP